jgi:hypothetical protein
MGVLGIDEHKREGADGAAEILEGDVTGAGSAPPEVDAGELNAGFDGEMGDAELAIEFKTAGVKGEGAGGGSGGGGFVDDADGDA